MAVNVNKMNRFYEDANDQHVRSTFVYVGMTNDIGYAYADKELTTKIDAETLKNLFLKGELVAVLETMVGESPATAYLRAISCVVHDGFALITCCINVNGDAETPGFYSAEYTG